MANRVDRGLWPCERANARVLPEFEPRKDSEKEQPGSFSVPAAQYCAFQSWNLLSATLGRNSLLRMPMGRL